MPFDPLLKDSKYSYGSPPISCECITITILIFALTASIIGNIMLSNKCNHVKTECELYGSLANGITSWGETSNWTMIPGSTMTGHNGTESINNINAIYGIYPTASTICFKSIRRFC